MAEISRYEDMIVNKVTKLRIDKKISKAHLARQIKMCRAYVTKLEKGDLQPSFEVALRIAKYFGVSVEDIFQLKEEGKP